MTPFDPMLRDHAEGRSPKIQNATVARCDSVVPKSLRIPAFFPLMNMTNCRLNYYSKQTTKLNILEANSKASGMAIMHCGQFRNV
jgi:hypothetical protein